MKKMLNKLGCKEEVETIRKVTSFLKFTFLYIIFELDVWNTCSCITK